MFHTKDVKTKTAYLKAEEQSDTHSESKGLLVIKATGDSSSIINKKTFQPVIY